MSAIVSAARESGRYKNSIAVEIDWPSRLPKEPLSERIARHIAATHKFPVPAGRVFANEIAALNFYWEDFKSALFGVVLSSNQSRPPELLLERKERRKFVHRFLEPFLPQDEIAANAQAEIPGIDLKSAAGMIRYGVAHRVPGLRIVYWLEHEWPFDALVTEVREGGIPSGYPTREEGPELGGHGSRIAQLVRHIDSDFGLDLTRIADWMENGRWPLETTAGAIFAAVSECGKTNQAFHLPAVELFWLFGMTRQLAGARKDLGDSLDFHLENLADEAILRPVGNELSAVPEPAPGPGSAPELKTGKVLQMADQKPVDQSSQQTGAQAASPHPPQAEAPVAAARNSSLIEYLESSPRKALHSLLALVRADNPAIERLPQKTRALLVASDKRIADVRSEAEQKRCYKLVHDSIPQEWKAGIRAQKTLVAYWDSRDAKDRGPVKTYVSNAKSLPERLPRNLVSSSSAR